MSVKRYQLYTYPTVALMEEPNGNWVAAADFDRAVTLLRRVMHDEYFGIGLSDDIREFLKEVKP